MVVVNCAAYVFETDLLGSSRLEVPEMEKRDYSRYMYCNLFSLFFLNIQLGFKICKQDTIITYFPIGVNTEINFVKFIMSDMLSE